MYLYFTPGQQTGNDDIDDDDRHQQKTRMNQHLRNDLVCVLETRPLAHRFGIFWHPLDVHSSRNSQQPPPLTHTHD